MSAVPMLLVPASGPLRGGPGGLPCVLAPQMTYAVETFACRQHCAGGIRREGGVLGGRLGVHWLRMRTQKLAPPLTMSPSFEFFTQAV